MAYYALFYEVVDDFVARRTAFREEHLKFAQEAHERGEVLLGGAMGDPVDRAMIILRGGSEQIARSFAECAPYVREGLVKRWEVRPWNVVIGAEAAGQCLSAGEEN